MFTHICPEGVRCLYIIHISTTSDDEASTIITTKHTKTIFHFSSLSEIVSASIQQRAPCPPA